MQAERNALRRVAFVVSLLVFLLAAGYEASAPAYAEAPLPDRPRPIVLPPRLPPEEDMGAYIALQIEPSPDRPMWTEVAWQAGDGTWHTIAGWSGLARPAGDLRWYVEQADLGKGPFRWTVYRRYRGDALAHSEPFMLPELSRQVTQVQVSLSPSASGPSASEGER